jgi:hypothetical protein
MTCVLALMGMLTVCFDPALLSADGRASRARLRRAEAQLSALDTGPPALVPADELRFWHRSLDSARAEHLRGDYAAADRLLGRDAGRIADALVRKERFELAGDPLEQLTLRHQQWQRFRAVNRIESPFEAQIEQRYAAALNQRGEDASPAENAEAARLLELDRIYDEAFESGRRTALTVDRDDRMSRRRSRSVRPDRGSPCAAGRGRVLRPHRQLLPGAGQARGSARHRRDPGADRRQRLRTPGHRAGVVGR